jgi:uncharacterized RDD family membrane protein YckC
MERSVEVSTGESVAFSYELAGLGSRFLAVFIDLTIQVSVAVVVVVLLIWAGSTIPDLRASARLTRTDKIAEAIAIGLVVFAMFLLFFGYFIFFETVWNGRTPGKRALGIRVVRDGGFPVDFSSALVRNCVRVVEAMLGFYAISAACALLSPQNRRLGDMAAGTIVVRDSAAQERPSASELRTDDPLVRELPDSERDLVLRYVERRASLADAPRRALARSIAALVRPKLAASFQHLDDDELLVHVGEVALR